MTNCTSKTHKVGSKRGKSSTIMDPTTQSNYLEISSQHVALDWHVDFTLKVISGSATHDLKVRKDGVEEVM